MDLAFTELDAHLKMYTNYKPIFLNYIRVIPGLDEVFFKCVCYCKGEVDSTPNKDFLDN